MTMYFWAQILLLTNVSCVWRQIQALFYIKFLTLKFFNDQAKVLL